MSGKSKILVFEFDGGSWNVIEPLLSQGKLPNLNRLMEKGAYGVLKSETPIISPRIWTTIYTGKPAHVHGAEFFVPSTMVKQKRLWDIFNEKGLKVGIFGSLVTCPPYPVNGFMVPSIFDTSPETYPDDYRVFQEVALGERSSVHGKEEKAGAVERLKAHIKKLLNLRSVGITFETFSSVLRYIISEKLLRYSLKDSYWRKASLHLQMSVDVFLNAYRRFKPDFATFHNHLFDAVSHKYWDCFEPQHFKDVSAAAINKYGKVIPECCIHSDKMLGKILAGIDPSTTVLVVSDHGMQALTNTIQPHHLMPEKLVKILGIDNNVIPARFGNKSFLYFTGDGKFSKENLVDTLKSMSLEKTGESILEVEMKEKYVVLTLGLKKMWKEKISGDTGVMIKGHGIYAFSEIFSQQRLEGVGDHYIEGIFVASGPNIKRGVKLKEANIYDMAPTVLTIMGLPAAKDMQGRVLTEIFSGEELNKGQIERIETYEDGTSGSEEQDDIDIEMTKDRLRLLGYL